MYSILIVDDEHFMRNGIAKVLPWLINQIRYAIPGLRAYEAQLYFALHGAEKADSVSKDGWNNGDVVPVNHMFLHKLPDDLSPAADPDRFAVLSG